MNTLGFTPILGTETSKSDKKTKKMNYDTIKTMIMEQSQNIQEIQADKKSIKTNSRKKKDNYIKVL